MMKTAISLPDALFESAESLAHRLGVSRSELFATAVAAFIAQHDDTLVTERLNAVYADAATEPPDLGLAALQARSLSHESW
jgi:metal-responsive CopG/Arc/MetJ family transcriptional regulator